MRREDIVRKVSLEFFCVAIVGAEMYFSFTTYYHMLGSHLPSTSIATLLSISITLLPLMLGAFANRRFQEECGWWYCAQPSQLVWGQMIVVGVLLACIVSEDVRLRDLFKKQD
jgi:uncharacterized membrane protein YdfJ with MMPL/SSD domain